MQGVVEGRDTGGSAETGLEDPTTGLAGTGTTWAEAVERQKAADKPRLQAETARIEVHVTAEVLFMEPVPKSENVNRIRLR